MDEVRKLEQAIQTLEAQREILGDEVVETSLGPLKAKLSELQSSPIAQEQRKQATILFMDIAGHTALTWDLDPEDQMAVVDPAIARMADKIVAFGGHVARFQGDGFKAVFGLPTAHEDDPQQAIRAGLAILEEAGNIADELEIARGLSGFQVRVGISTGLVFSGGETEGEDTIKGMTVNLAARLESAAPPGGLFISHHTYRHVRGIFVVEPHEPILAKGFPEPVPVYLVRQEKPRAFRLETRGLEGLETRTIGREHELNILKDAFQNIKRKKQTTVVTIVGEAGVGKSRLLYEFDNWLEIQPENIRYFKGRASQQGQSSPKYLLRDMLTARFQVFESDPLDIVREKFVAGIQEFLPDQYEMKAHILGAWLGHDFSDSPHLQPIQNDPEQIKNRATLYLAQFFSAITAKTPAALLLEDIHWADRSSLDTVVDLVRRQAELPLLVICLARPSLFERYPDWGENIPIHIRLDLDLLSAESTSDLVREILRLVDPLPQFLIDLIASRAEGNPFYAEELVKMLIDEGAIITAPDTWKVEPDQLRNIKVPDTLTGVLQARLDKLSQVEKRSVKKAAVIGRIFWDQALSKLEEEGHEGLSRLHERELVFPRPESAFAGTREYIFKHALLRDVIYATVLKRVRAQYHSLVAEWLAEIAENNGRSNEYAALIGEHYQSAGEKVKAAEWYRRAGDHAAGIYANPEALRYLTLSFDFLPEEDIYGQFDLLLAREKLFGLKGDRPGQFEDLSKLEILADRLGDAFKAQVVSRQASYAHVIGDFDQTTQLAQKALELAKRIGNFVIVSEAYSRWGEALSRQGQFSFAKEKIQAGVVIAQDHGIKRWEASGFRGLGTVERLLGNITLALEYFQKALEISRDIGDRVLEGWIINDLGSVAASQNDYSAANNLFEQSLKIKREIGDRKGESNSLAELGGLAIERGDIASAKNYCLRSLKIRKEIGDRQGEAYTLSLLGGISASQGDFTNAKIYYEKALVIRREIGERHREGWSIKSLGFVALSQKEYVGAKEYLQTSLEIFRENGDRWGEGDNLRLLGEAALSADNLSAAENYYVQAIKIHQEMNFLYAVFEDWAGLAKVKILQGDREAAFEYCDKILDFLQDNSNSYRYLICAFRFTWETLTDLGEIELAEYVLELAINVIKDFLDKNSDPDQQKMYLSQPHHAVLWAAWEKKVTSKNK